MGALCVHKMLTAQTAKCFMIMYQVPLPQKVT